jgi:hypothetical protein
MLFSAIHSSATSPDLHTGSFLCRIFFTKSFGCNLRSPLSKLHANLINFLGSLSFRQIEMCITMGIIHMLN